MWKPTLQPSPAVPARVEPRAYCPSPEQICCPPLEQMVPVETVNLALRWTRDEEDARAIVKSHQAAQAWARLGRAVFDYVCWVVVCWVVLGWVVFCRVQLGCIGFFGRVVLVCAWLGCGAEGFVDLFWFGV